MRLINPVGWKVEHLRQTGSALVDGNAAEDDVVGEPMLTLINGSGNRLHVHPISDRLVRVLHKLPNKPLEQERHRHPHGRDGVAWELNEGRNSCEWHAEHEEGNQLVKLISPEGIVVQVDFSHTAKLSWYWPERVNGSSSSAQAPFLSDFKTSYQYCRRTGRMFHLTERESYMPLFEHHRSANDNHRPPHPQTSEFIYGLGETKGPMLKTGKRFIIDARDSLGYDVEETDPLYKLCPFYVVHNSSQSMWYGMYYNSLQPTVADFGAEHDFSTGNFRSFSVENGPIDYYVLLGASSLQAGSTQPLSIIATTPAKPRLRDVISQFAALVTPYSPSPVTGEREDAPRNWTPGWQASPTLPRLSSFGYLASSMTLSERDDAQAAVEEYVIETRAHGFPVDGMHLSSGYCLDEQTGERMYFVWNKRKYPDPPGMGKKLEKDLGCHLIINVKPWLLEGHIWYKDAALSGAFVQAAKDAIEAQETDKVGMHNVSRTFHWSTSMGQTAKGSHFDFSSEGGAAFWRKMIKEGVSANGITGLWIDNNEYSTLIDDAERVKGDFDLWAAPEAIAERQQVPSTHEQRIWARQVSERMGWGKGEIEIGAVGRSVMTMGMAKASWEEMTAADPATRPVVVTRSAVPGMQAYAHGTWSGDNSTTWKCLKYNTKMTLSMGLSFGPGLYGHDIGGFAGAHSPSPELLVRWCQQSVWHSRFTLHSWKAISTTFYMYADNEEVMQALQAALALRYQLVPLLYSLYVTDYQRRGWPVLRPLLWKHSGVRACLGQDEQFLLADTILIAPVLDFGARHVTFNVPHQLDGSDSNDQPTECWWYDVHGKQWIKPAVHDMPSQSITLPAPLSQCPTLVRENGIMVCGEAHKFNVFDQPGRQKRHIKLFPSPAERGSTAPPVRFTLVEDDGLSNDAAAGAFTEVEFQCRADEETIYLQTVFKRAEFRGIWTWHIELPSGESRKLHLSSMGAAHTLKQEGSGHHYVLSV